MLPVKRDLVRGVRQDVLRVGPARGADADELLAGKALGEQLGCRRLVRIGGQEICSIHDVLYCVVIDAKREIDVRRLLGRLLPSGATVPALGVFMAEVAEDGLNADQFEGADQALVADFLAVIARVIGRAEHDANELLRLARDDRLPQLPEVAPLQKGLS
jgi:hypothetical protein